MLQSHPSLVTTKNIIYLKDDNDSFDGFNSNCESPDNVTQDGVNLRTNLKKRIIRPESSLIEHKIEMDNSVQTMLQLSTQNIFPKKIFRIGKAGSSCQSKVQS